jgi:hypothetical protein
MDPDRRRAEGVVLIVDGLGVGREIVSTRAASTLSWS